MKKVITLVLTIVMLTSTNISAASYRSPKIRDVPAPISIKVEECNVDALVDAPSCTTHMNGHFYYITAEEDDWGDLTNYLYKDNQKLCKVQCNGGRGTIHIENRLFLASESTIWEYVGGKLKTVNSKFGKSYPYIQYMLTDGKNMYVATHTSGTRPKDEPNYNYGYIETAIYKVTTSGTVTKISNTLLSLREIVINQSSIAADKNSLAYSWLGNNKYGIYIKDLAVKKDYALCNLTTHDYWGEWFNIIYYKGYLIVNNESKILCMSGKPGGPLNQRSVLMNESLGDIREWYLDGDVIYGCNDDRWFKITITTK